MLVGSRMPELDLANPQCNRRPDGAPLLAKEGSRQGRTPTLCVSPYPRGHCVACARGSRTSTWATSISLRPDGWGGSDRRPDIAMAARRAGSAWRGVSERVEIRQRISIPVYGLAASSKTQIDYARRRMYAMRAPTSSSVRSSGRHDMLFKGSPAPEGNLFGASAGQSERSSATLSFLGPRQSLLLDRFRPLLRARPP